MQGTIAPILSVFGFVIRENEQFFERRPRLLDHLLGQKFLYDSVSRLSHGPSLNKILYVELLAMTVAEVESTIHLIK